MTNVMDFHFSVRNEIMCYKVNNSTASEAYVRDSINIIFFPFYNACPTEPSDEFIIKFHVMLDKTYLS
jgi:hypothetical protein